MLITICGSVKFVREMRDAAAMLKEMGHDVLLSKSAERDEDKEFRKGVKEKDIKEYYSIKRERMKLHFDKVRKADAILVLNYDKDGRKNYIGPNTFLEMAIAFDHGKKIFVLNSLPEDSHNEELITLSPICLNGDLNKIA